MVRSMGRYANEEDAKATKKKKKKKMKNEGEDKEKKMMQNRQREKEEKGDIDYRMNSGNHIYIEKRACGYRVQLLTEFS